MTIQDLGSIGELVAAIATVVTLVYLAVQIRSNTAALKAEGSRATRTSATPMVVAVAQDGELARIFNAGLADYEQLNAEERTRFAFMLGDFIGNSATKYTEVLLGIVSEEEFDENERGVIAPYLTAPGGRALWKRISTRYPTAFREYVERRIL